MYSSCIFCSAELGSNDVLEGFPVGRSVAFDAARGRLWAVCGGCGRWNLAPLEERWEPVEAAEAQFRGARTRVQSENVGVARMGDGTRLIRVGDAVGAEFAAWRYGEQLVKRRYRYIAMAAAGGLGVAAIGGMQVAGFLSGTFLTYQFGVRGIRSLWRQKVVHRVAADQSPSGREIILRRWHLPSLQLHPSRDGQLTVRIDQAHRKRASTTSRELDMVLLSGSPAEALLRRAMTRINNRGANRSDVERATQYLEYAGSIPKFLELTARAGAPLGKAPHGGGTRIETPRALALEMALNEEQERQALEGELAALEAAWREAEEIAAIADSLLDRGLARARRALAR